jgi:uncharacterized protein (TIGR02099 family)
VKAIIAKVVRKLWYLFTIIIISAALLVSITRLITPVFNQHRSDVEAWASQLLQAPVTIREVQVGWHGYQPAITLNNVTILDLKTHQPKLTVQHLEVSFSIWRSLWHWQPSLESISISGVHLTVYYRSSGKFEIDELDNLSVQDRAIGTPIGTEEVLAWIFLQPRLALRNIDVRFLQFDKQEKLIILKDLLINNNHKQHTLAGAVVLAQDVPTKVDTHITWEGNVQNLKQIKAHIYLAVEDLALAQWASNMTLSGLQVKNGMAKIKVWAEWQADQWQEIQTTFQFDNLELFSLSQKRIEKFQQLSANMGWKREGGKQVFAGDHLIVNFSDHHWPQTDFYLALAIDASGKPFLNVVRFGYFNLADASHLVLSTSILEDKAYQQLLALDLKGELQNFQVLLPSNLSTLDFSLSGKFARLTVGSLSDLPGIDNFSGSVLWDGKQGQVDLACQRANITVKKLFSNPLHFDQLISHFQINKTSNGSWSFVTKNSKASNTDVASTINLMMNFTPGESPTVDLTADFVMANAAHITSYLPMKTFDADLAHWLNAAFLKGRIDAGKVLVQGRLSDFPFANQNGKFLVQGEINKLDFVFAPDWPMIHNLGGLLTFTGSTMVAEVKSGNILGVPITQVRGVIPYIGDNGPQILQVDTKIHSTLIEGLHFIQMSPLQKTLGKDLLALKLTGPLDLSLGLSIPLKHPADATVLGDINLIGAELALPDWKLTVSDINGLFHFTEHGVNAKDLQGNLLGEKAVIDISTIHQRESTSLDALIKSKVTVSALQKWLQLDMSSIVTGSMAYQAELHLTPAASASKARQDSIHFSSDLKGIAIDLPEPLGKAADKANNLQLDIALDQLDLLKVKINYAKSFTGDLRYKKASTGLQLLDGEVRAGKINIFGQQLTQARAQLSQEKDYRLIKLNSVEVVGQVKIPFNLREQTIQGNFEHFYVVPFVGKQDKSKIDPKDLPALSISCNDMRYGEVNLGRVVLNGVPSKTGEIIKELRIESAAVELNATGEWSLRDRQYRSHLQGNAVTTQISNLLSEWGFHSKNLVGSTGKASFDLSWPDAPYHLGAAGLQGNISLQLGKGHVAELSEESNAKMGMGRLLSVLSLTTLPRRLSFDFSDLSEKGYSFDYMKGDFELREGSAFTRNMRFDGPVARIDILGRIGLSAKDVDVKLSVTPYVTDSLPVVAAIAGGPVVGVAAWVVNKVIIGQANLITYQYNISGSWAQPVWKQVSVTPSVNSH